MKKMNILFCLVSILMMRGESDVTPVETKITNGSVSAKIYLPDRDSGYYRGSRFDWSGVIAELQWNRHNYFGQWFEKYNATNHDAILGPVEAFDPIGFDQARPGGTFIKIGVGALVKPDESSYDFIKPYVISNYGKWRIQKKPLEVKFQHTLKDNRYGYSYTKIIALNKSSAQLILSHSLRNTGKQRIDTKVYDHNFFVIDGQLTGPGSVIRFPVALNDSAANQFVKFTGAQLEFIKELGHRTFALRNMTNGTTASYEFQIENRNTGAGVKIKCDRPISKLDFWSAAKTVCPEPYIDIRLEPGQEFTWKITYDFYTTSTSTPNISDTTKK
jgi:hypothetical protein